MKEIIEQLSEIGFKENDAKVYIALLQLGKSNPTKISKKTNIVRARVYDSLKRLEKQGYIEREAVNHAPEYVAIDPDVVISNIKKKLAKKLDITEQLPNFIKETIKVKPNKETWAIKGMSKIKSKIEQIITQTNTELLALITPDYTKNAETWIYNLLLSKAQDPVEISIGMKVTENNKAEVKKLMAKGINVYHWSLTEEMPLGIYTSDSKDTLITVIGSWKKYYEHNIGFLVQDPPPHHKGFEFLIQWFFSSCKRAEEKIKDIST